MSEIWEGSELTSRNPSGREQGKSTSRLHLSENEFVRLTAQREWNLRSCVHVERSQWQGSPIWGIVGNGWKKALTQSLVRSGRASSEKVEGLPTSQNTSRCPALLRSCLFPTFRTKLQHTPSPWEQVSFSQPAHNRGPRLDGEGGSPFPLLPARTHPGPSHGHFPCSLSLYPILEN